METFDIFFVFIDTALQHYNIIKEINNLYCIKKNKTLCSSALSFVLLLKLVSYFRFKWRRRQWGFAGAAWRGAKAPRLLHQEGASQLSFRWNGPAVCLLIHCKYLGCITTRLGCRKAKLFTQRSTGEAKHFSNVKMLILRCWIFLSFDVMSPTC